MSAPSCLIFFGVRRAVNDAEIESLETRSHPLFVAARGGGLHHYWGNFGEPGDKYYQFVGANLGLLGLENSLEIRIKEVDLAKRIEETKAKLKHAGIQEEPVFFAQWMPDANP